LKAVVCVPSRIEPTTTPNPSIPPTSPFTPRRVTPEARQMTISPVSERPATTPSLFTARAQLCPEPGSPKSCISPFA
jgi:hypothetical protein